MRTKEEVLVILNIKREKGYLYFINTAGNVCRQKMTSHSQPSEHRTIVDNERLSPQVGLSQSGDAGELSKGFQSSVGDLDVKDAAERPVNHLTLHQVYSYWDEHYGALKHENGVLELHTGGWSINEELLSDMDEKYWKELIREKTGGHYWFKFEAGVR